MTLAIPDTKRESAVIPVALKLSGEFQTNRLQTSCSPDRCQFVHFGKADAKEDAPMPVGCCEKAQHGFLGCCNDVIDTKFPIEQVQANREKLGLPPLERVDGSWQRIDPTTPDGEAALKIFDKKWADQRTSQRTSKPQKKSWWARTTQWFKALVSGFVADIKHLFGGSSKKPKTV